MDAEAVDEFGLVGGRLEGRYDVERVVAAGGFGVVYLGQHRALRTAVALKVLRIPRECSEAARLDFAQRFLAEAQTLAALQHPAVVRALDFGVSPMPSGTSAPWMALEWIEGETLKARLDAHRGAPLAPRELLALLRPVLEALADAHAAGIAHRDVKPANIMLPRAPGKGPSARILDFGIAKAMRPDERASVTGETRTASVSSAFSLKYAAPEQLSGLRTGPWTDVHALGLVLVEGLTGREAYPGSDAMEVTAAATRPERPTPAALGFDAGPWEPVLARAMAFKPPDRYPDARALLEALEAAVPESLRALPPPPPRRAAGLLDTEAPSLVTGPIGPGALPSRSLTGAPREARAPRAVLAAVSVALVAVAALGVTVAFSRAPRTESGAPSPSIPRTVLSPSGSTEAHESAPPSVSAMESAPSPRAEGDASVTAEASPASGQGTAPTERAPRATTHGHPGGRSGRVRARGGQDASTPGRFVPTPE